MQTLVFYTIGFISGCIATRLWIRYRAHKAMIETLGNVEPISFKVDEEDLKHFLREVEELQKKAERKKE